MIKNSQISIEKIVEYNINIITIKNIVPELIA